MLHDKEFSRAVSALNFSALLGPWRQTITQCCTTPSLIDDYHDMYNNFVSFVDGLAIWKIEARMKTLSLNGTNGT